MPVVTEANGDAAPTSRKRRRRSLRSQKSQTLAKSIVEGKEVVFVTGAGISVDSGIRQFRGESGLWSSVIWKQATREAFRKSPLEWYNRFWLPHFGTSPSTFAPNAGHDALCQLQQLFPNSVHIITQNVDGLHRGNVIEAHGRVGLYKCIPENDSDTDSEPDEEGERPVHLGSRRKSRATRRVLSKQGQSVSSECSRRPNCKYQQLESITLDMIEPPQVRRALQAGNRTLEEPPLCPFCHRPCPPQALLFDEGYHSHDFYQFERVEAYLSSCDVLVFVGTSFAVTITDVALEHARENGIPVYNFNTSDVLEANSRLNVENIVGKSNETLPRLLMDVNHLMAEAAHPTR